MQPPGILGYDVFRYASTAATGVDVFSGNTFDGTCLTNAVANAPLGTLVSTTDNGTPATGTTYMYQVGHSSTNALGIAPLGVQPASATTRPGQLVTAGVVCP